MRRSALGRDEHSKVKPCEAETPPKLDSDSREQLAADLLARQLSVGSLGHCGQHRR